MLQVQTVACPWSLNVPLTEEMVGVDMDCKAKDVALDAEQLLQASIDQHIRNAKPTLEDRNDVLPCSNLASMVCHCQCAICFKKGA